MNDNLKRLKDFLIRKKVDSNATIAIINDNCIVVIVKDYKVKPTSMANYKGSQTLIEIRYVNSKEAFRIRNRTNLNRFYTPDFEKILKYIKEVKKNEQKQRSIRI